MTDRLDRIEAILETMAQRLDRVAVSQELTQQISESNARSIQAWESRINGIEEVSTSAATNARQELTTAITDTVSMIGDLSQQQAETDRKFNLLLEEARADRQTWQQQAEANATEHRAFTQNIQVLLAEIARLWQQLRAG